MQQLTQFHRQAFRMGMLRVYTFSLQKVHKSQQHPLVPLLAMAALVTWWSSIHVGSCSLLCDDNTATRISVQVWSRITTNCPSGTIWFLHILVELSVQWYIARVRVVNNVIKYAAAYRESRPATRSQNKQSQRWKADLWTAERCLYVNWRKFSSFLSLLTGTSL